MRIHLKNLLFILLIGLALSACKKKTTTPPPDPNKCEDITDARDGQKYKVVKIGDQCWMAENLNFETPSESSCYDDDPANCDQWGRIYTWDAVKDACPDGWRLPTKEDFNTLIDEVGGVSVAGTALKVGGSSGFNAILAGGKDANGASIGVNIVIAFWSNSNHSTNSFKKTLTISTAADAGLSGTSNASGNYCRCIKD
jgi:uncharacterized protein (TIGR02145 family)